MSEVWRNIEGYEGYQTSNLGRVKSLKRSKEKILKFKESKGYFVICLCKNNKKKWHSVHRLVAEAFIPNPDNLPQVNHKDECKTNNIVDNLEWCSAKYNLNYNDGRKRRAEKRYKAINQYTIDNKFIKNWSSAIEIERELDYDHRNIAACCKDKRKTAYGYIWRYK